MVVVMISLDASKSENAAQPAPDTVIFRRLGTEMSSTMLSFSGASTVVVEELLLALKYKLCVVR